MFERIGQLADPQHPNLIIAYWPGLDSLAHERGIESAETASHFMELDKGCEMSLTPLTKQGVEVIITADHGLIDTREELLDVALQHVAPPPGELLSPV